MKGRANGFISGVLFTLVFVSLIGTAFATKGRVAVNVDYNDIRVTLDGEAVALVDANGNAVEPFAINGTTYLPVRAVANALGLEVGWDQETSTVVLNTKDARPQRNGFNVATNQNVKVGSYTFSIPNYFVQNDDGFIDDSGAYLWLDSYEFEGDDKMSFSELLIFSDILSTMFDDCEVADGRIIRTESNIAGMAWDIFVTINSEGGPISLTGLFFIFPDIDNHNASYGIFLTFDMAEYAYDDDFSKIISSVKKEAPSSSTTNMTTNTPSSGNSGGASSSGGSQNNSNDNDMPDGSRMVYVTPTGSRYHYDSTCNGGRYTLTTLEDAQRRGLSPCQKCVLH